MMKRFSNGISNRIAVIQIFVRFFDTFPKNEDNVPLMFNVVDYLVPP